MNAIAAPMTGTSAGALVDAVRVKFCVKTPPGVMLLWDTVAFALAVVSDAAVISRLPAGRSTGTFGIWYAPALSVYATKDE